MDIDYTKLQTIIETREKFENDEYGKQVVSYLVQKKPMIVSKKGYDRLTNFKKFGTPASGTAAARKGTISHLPGIIFDEGNREDLVETKLTKDADAIELEKLDKAKLGIEEKKEKKKVEGLMEEFGLQTEYTVSVAEVVFSNNDSNSQEYKDEEAAFKRWFYDIHNAVMLQNGIMERNPRVAFRKRGVERQFTGMAYFTYENDSAAEAICKAIEGKVYNDYILHAEWFEKEKR